MSDDLPLEELPDAGQYHGTVIDLDGVRIKLGRTPYRAGKPCEHKSLIYCQSERRIWCEECKRTIDNFDAFLTYTRHFSSMVREAESKLRTADDALKATVHRRATKHLDHAWSGGLCAVACIHCGGGLLPEDYADGVKARTSRELEMQRRKKSGK